MPELPWAVTLTAAEYEALPPDNRIELVDGVLRVRPAPTTRHQRVVERLRVALAAACPDSLHGLAP